MLGKNISTLPKLKFDLSDHPFIKDDIFEGIVNFPPRGTPIGFITQYCEHKKISYISQSENNISWNVTFPTRSRTNVWILSIDRKEPKSIQQVLEAI